MKNILVTGGCGFIGTNFVYYMLSNPDFNGRIINIDKLTYAGRKDNLQDVESDKRYRFFNEDIIKTGLKIPEGIKVEALFPIGYEQGKTKRK